MQVTPRPDALETWLRAAHDEGRIDVDNPDGFLAATLDIDVEPGERLRRLAIFLEGESAVDAETELARWSVFARLYDAAEGHAAHPARVLESRAVTALHCFEQAAEHDPDRALLWTQAHEASSRATECAPRSADAAYLRGATLYASPGDRLDEALAWFDQALELDETHAWARLYRAHALHDLQRWVDAAEAYALADTPMRGGPQPWRLELLREQRAYCLMRAGRLGESRIAFENVLTRRERALDRGERPMESDVLFTVPALLAAAARGPLRAVLHDRVQRLLEREAWGLTL
ncbi:MAG: hypothetical protein AAGA54_23735 [Myxococcota bacterium]